MTGLLRKASLFYFTHLLTFSMIGVLPSFEGKYGVFIVMSALVPMWMSSAVLWSERMENYRFLKLLPITGNEIVTLKLSIIAGSGLAALGIITVYILTAGESWGPFSINFITAFTGCLIGILVAYVWQICVWKFGIQLMTPIILVSVFLQFLLIMIPLVSRQRPDVKGINDLAVFHLFSHPAWFLPSLVLIVLAGCGLRLLAVQVFEQSEPE